MRATDQAEAIRIPVEGWFWDEVYEKHPVTGKDVLVEKTAMEHNLQMLASLTLLAGLLLNDSGFTGGILKHAQGTGNPSWDSGPIPAPADTDTQLVAEAGRKTPDSIVYVDPGTFVVQAPGVRTRAVKVTTTFDYGDLVGITIREQALFGGTATGAANSGLCFNQIRQAGRFKSGSIRLIRNVILVLSKS